MAVYKITLSASSWTLATAALWYNTSTPGKFYSDSGATTEAASVQIPTRELYRFNGFYSSTSGGTQYIDADGNFTAALLSLSITSAKTFYAQGTQVSYKITLSDNNGSGGDGALYYRISGGGVYADYLCEGSPAESVTKPSRTNYAFAGYHNGTSTPGTQYIDKDGRLTSDLSSITLTGAKTIYARWVAPYKVTVSANSGSGGTTAFWFDSVSGGFYSDNNLTDPITAIVPHTRECFSFVGCYSSNNTTSTLRVSEDGTIAADWTPTAAATIYAQWSRVSWKVTLSKQSGSGGTDAIYYRIDGGGFYLDDLCDLNGPAVQHVETPTRTGYDFVGYYSASSGGTQYVDADGDFTASLSSLAPTAAQTFYAHWAAHVHTLTFDPNGGTCSTASMSVTYGSAVGTLPTPTSIKGTFAGWYVNGSKITSTTVWSADGDAVAVAAWDLHFGKVTDYFNFASANLVPISSDSGDGKRRTCSANATWSSGAQSGGAGRYSSGVNDIGGIWRNPTVTYRVVGDVTFTTQLGKAFAATKSGSTMTISGWMITSVRVQTAVGKFPTITVSATANEGADAINLFSVSVSVSARARAQYLMSAVSGGGNLQTCDIEASCTPVVCAENNMPCASDVVQGKYVAKATTYAPSNDAAPTAGNGFTSVGEPKACGDKDYPMWSITAEKEIT